MRSLLFSLALLFSAQVFGQNLAYKTTELVNWRFAKVSPSLWMDVTLSHTCNALDGHSAKYYRGKTYYKYMLQVDAEQLQRPLFLLFKAAGQAALVTVNDVEAGSHRGGYTPFLIPLQGLLQEGKNTLMVMCDNTLDVNLAPVGSDFNKNNGLYGRVYLLEMNEVYASPTDYGLYRLHVTPSEISEKSARTCVQAKLVNSAASGLRVNILFELEDKSGRVCHRNKRQVELSANDTYDYTYEFVLKHPHLWNGLADPYLYTARITFSDTDGEMLDRVETTVGYRYFRVTRDEGFFLNGRPYPLRGVCLHQDWDGKASAMVEEDFDADYAFVKELGANFVRLAHYPHDDYAFRKCDELGLVVQTEIPWVNVCGVNATEGYFDNLHQQMREMIVNLYNHPSICFWSMWNELNEWGNNDSLQGELDPARVVRETKRLYAYAKSLDPHRLVGVTDDSNYSREGYTGFGVDFYSENRYNGWYHETISNFQEAIEGIHRKMGVVNVSEYGCGINPFCHSQDPLTTTDRGTGGARHDEEFGNFYHESQWQQLCRMPFLNFTSVWVMFDFAVADRLEGYMDTSDGVTFTESEFRKYTNDKGLVTRDRKTKKDVFYLYKSSWNHAEETIYITSRRYTTRPIDEPIEIKVYSNAQSLTLYQNGRKVQTLDSSGEISGVIWKFKPLKFQTASDTFRVVSDSGKFDEVTFATFSPEK